MVKQFATAGIGVSRQAAATMFGDGWETDNRWQVIPCGIDLAPFAQDLDQKALRAEMGLPEGAPVVGHVGRFVASRNHDFVVDVFGALLRRRPDAWLLLVGDGPLKDEVRDKVARSEFAARVIFTGPRRDVPRLLRGAIDVLLFPSLHEGLGLAAVEAQAAGIPTLASDRIPDEACVTKEIFDRLALDAGLDTWAEALHRAFEATRQDPSRQLDVMRQSPFEIGNNIALLDRFYQEQCRRQRATP